MEDELERQVIELIARKKKLEPAQISLDSTFEQLAIDSLDGMDLIFTFEDVFNVTVPDQAAQTMKSVRQAVEGLRALKANRSVEAG